MFYFFLYGVLFFLIIRRDLRIIFINIRILVYFKWQMIIYRDVTSDPNEDLVYAPPEPEVS